MVRLGRRTLLMVIIISLTLIGAVTVAAQTDTPINISENKLGEITAQTPVLIYTLQVTTPQTVSVQVLPITAGFTPTLQIFDPSGVRVFDSASAAPQTPLNLTGSGQYRLLVIGSNSANGQFLISVQPSAAAPPQPITAGVPINATVDAQTAQRLYSFAAAAGDVLLLTVRSGSPDAGPVVTLIDADTGDTLGLTSTRLSGVRYRIPAGAQHYQIEVAFSGETPAEPFALCLTTESGSVACPEVEGSGSNGAAAPTATVEVVAVVPTAAPPPTLTPVIPPTFAPVFIDPNGTCMVGSGNGSAINVRSGPSLDFNIVGHLNPNQTLPVIGRLADNSWYQINSSGTLGWVSATVVRIGGICNGVSVITPPTATPIATAAFPGATDTPIATATLTNTPGARLNFGLAANFGTSSLVSGFMPDPFAVSITSGGSVDMSYLGTGCSGYATSAPDYQIDYTSGGFPTLRFYFIGGGDTTLVINSPANAFFCSDDSFGTIDPAIDFNNPSSGSYDIWIGSFYSGANVTGILYVTENTNNHP